MVIRAEDKKQMTSQPLILTGDVSQHNATLDGKAAAKATEPFIERKTESAQG